MAVGRRSGRRPEHTGNRLKYTGAVLIGPGFTVIPSAKRSLTKLISSRSSVGVTGRRSSGYPGQPPAWILYTGPLRQAVLTRALSRRARCPGAAGPRRG